MHSAFFHNTDIKLNLIYIKILTWSIWSISSNQVYFPLSPFSPPVDVSHILITGIVDAKQAWETLKLAPVVRL